MWSRNDAGPASSYRFGGAELWDPAIPGASQGWQDPLMPAVTSGLAGSPGASCEFLSWWPWAGQGCSWLGLCGCHTSQQGFGAPWALPGLGGICVLWDPCGQPGRSSQHPKPLSSSDSSSCLSSSSALHTVTVCAAISQFFLSVVMFPGICLCFGAAQLSLNIPPELCPPAQLCFRLEAFSEFHPAPGWPSRAGSRC